MRSYLAQLHTQNVSASRLYRGCAWYDYPQREMEVYIFSYPGYIYSIDAGFRVFREVRVT